MGSNSKNDGPKGLPKLTEIVWPYWGSTFSSAKRGHRNCWAQDGSLKNIKAQMSPAIFLRLKRAQQVPLTVHRSFFKNLK